MSLGSAVPAELGEERARRRLSKADTLRATYGFDDVSLAPGTETLDPADVDLAVEIGGLKLDDPNPCRGHGRRRGRRVLRRAREAGRRRGAQPRGRPDTLRRPCDRPGRDRRRARRSRSRTCSPRHTHRRYRDDLVARRIAEIHEAARPRSSRRRRPPPAALGPLQRRGRRRCLPRPVAGLLGAPPRRRLRAAGACRVHEATCRSRSASATRPRTRPRSS